jgi:hypothetical protein
MQQARSSEQKVADKKKIIKNRLQTRQPSTPSRSWHGWRWFNTSKPKKRTKSLRAGPSPAQIWPLPADTVSAAVQRTKRDMAPKMSLYTDLGHQYWPWDVRGFDHTRRKLTKSWEHLLAQRTCISMNWLSPRLLPLRFIQQTRTP